MYYKIPVPRNTLMETTVYSESLSAVSTSSVSSVLLPTPSSMATITRLATTVRLFGNPDFRGFARKSPNWSPVRDPMSSQ